MTQTIQNEALIKSVEKHPILWDITNAFYKYMNETRKAWMTVCQDLYWGFDQLDEETQQEFGQAVVKRWSNIRDCFQRSERKIRYSVVYGSATRKNYIYSDLLKFLKKRKDDDLPTEENSSNDDQTMDSEKVAEEPEPSETSNHDSETLTEGKQQDSSPLRNLTFLQDVVPFLDSLEEGDVLEFQLKVLQAVSDLKKRGNTPGKGQQGTSYGLRTSRGLQYHSVQSSSSLNRQKSAKRHLGLRVTPDTELDATPSESSKTRKHRKRPSSPEDTPNDRKKKKSPPAQTYSTSIPPKKTESSSIPIRPDEFDTFGQHVANQLRNLPLSNAIVCQNFINSYLSEERLKVINDSYVPNLRNSSAASNSSFDPQEDNLDENSSDHLDSLVKIEEDDVS